MAPPTGQIILMLQLRHFQLTGSPDQSLSRAVRVHRRQLHLSVSQGPRTGSASVLLGKNGLHGAAIVCGSSPDQNQEAKRLTVKHADSARGDRTLAAAG